MPLVAGSAAGQRRPSADAVAETAAEDVAAAAGPDAAPTSRASAGAGGGGGRAGSVDHRRGELATSLDVERVGRRRAGDVRRRVVGNDVVVAAAVRRPCQFVFTGRR